MLNENIYEQQKKNITNEEKFVIRNKVELFAKQLIDELLLENGRKIVKICFPLRLRIIKIHFQHRFSLVFLFRF